MKHKCGILEKKKKKKTLKKLNPMAKAMAESF